MPSHLARCKPFQSVAEGSLAHPMGGTDTLPLLWCDLGCPLLRSDVYTGGNTLCSSDEQRG